MAPTVEIIVTQMHRAEHGELEARISVGNGAVPVTRRFGSWGTIPDGEGRSVDLLPRYAEALQTRARRFERRERGEDDR